MRSSRKKSKRSIPIENLSLENKTKANITGINFERYLGSTVTVFVNAGGEAGKGFTGILIGQTETYIRLLVMPSLPPSCTLGNSCSRNTNNILFCALCQYNANSSLGSIAVIPIQNVAAFVHNAINSGQF